MHWQTSTGAMQGKVYIVEVCPECGALRKLRIDMLEGRGPWLDPALGPYDDFLVVNEYRTVDEQSYITRAGAQLISGKALSVLLSINAKGLEKNYCEDPKIEFGMFIR
jgi:hypothetical protein